MKQSTRPFPWLALLLLVVSVGVFWGLPRLWPAHRVDVTFEGPSK